jgi:exopolysaccharide biosynthesis protein
MYVTPTPATTIPASKPTPSPRGNTAQDTAWKQIEAGMEFRRLPLSVDERHSLFNVVRLDPKTYRIRVAYDTQHPGRVSEWATAVKPVALINGGYFDENKKATALVIFDGIARGESYQGFGGMVVVNAAGEFELRSLRQQPYDPQEQLQQAMQSAPMLIQPGGVVSDLEADEDRSRRTVIARDTRGHILLMVDDFPVFTLKELAHLLKQSDLDLDAALNLDGGRSTGMYLNTSAMRLTIDSFDSVPLVLVVDKKS